MIWIIGIESIATMRLGTADSMIVKFMALPQTARLGLLGETLAPHKPNAPFTRTAIQVIVLQKNHLGMNGISWY